MLVFLSGSVLHCNLAHRRTVAMLRMLFKVKSNPVHPLNGALPLPYVPKRVTRGAMVAHRYSFAPPSCRISQCRWTFMPISQCLCETILMPLRSMMWDWQVLREESMPSCWPNLLFLFPCNYFLFTFLSLVECMGG